MKLYNAQAPNPWRVRIFCMEKGLDVPRVDLEFGKGDTRTPEFLAMNSLGEVPVLELDDGRVLTESVAICRYLESLHPEPNLMGRDGFDQARIEMWNRRIELHVSVTVANVGLHTIPFFAKKVEQVPVFAEAQRRTLAKKWAWLDREMADGRPYFAGDRFTVADITGMLALRVADIVDETIPPELANLKQWETSVRSRSSWNA